MQHVATQIASLNKPGISIPKVVLPQTHTAAPHLVAVWRNAFAAFIAHAPPALGLGVLGFAMLPLLGTVVAILSVPFTRIALTCLAMHGSLHDMRRRQMAALLAMSGAYMVLMLAGQVGIGVTLRAWDFNLDYADQATTTWASPAQTVVMRSVNALSGVSDSPLQYWLPKWRNWGFSEWVEQPNARYTQQLIKFRRLNDLGIFTNAGISAITNEVADHRRNRPDLQVLFIGSVVTLFVAETLFAFRSLVGVQPVRLLRLSLTHFGTMAGHLWSLRLVVVGLRAICVFMPMAVVGRYSYLAQDLGWFGSPLQGYALAICLALINAVTSTFEAVYVAQLYRVLLEPCKCEHFSQQSELLFAGQQHDSMERV